MNPGVAGVQIVPFYEFYEGLQEGWDGPALLVFSNGNKVGARLDRNGLRPARYWRTSDDMVYVASEVHALPSDPHSSSILSFCWRQSLVHFGCISLSQRTFTPATQLLGKIALHQLDS